MQQSVVQSLAKFCLQMYLLLNLMIHSFKYREIHQQWPYTDACQMSAKNKYIMKILYKMLV